MDINKQQQHSFVEEEIDLSKYWKVINARKWSILSLAFLVALITVLIVYSMTPIYSAKSILLIEQNQPNIPSMDDIYGLSGKDKKYSLTQMELLKTRKLAMNVVRKLKLNENAEFLPKKGGFHPVADFKAWLAITFVKDETEKKAPKTVSEDDILKGFAAKLKGRLSVALVKDTHLITIKFHAESPELAAQMANALAEAYIDDQLLSRLEMSQKATKWMEGRLSVLKVKLQESEQVLQNYKEINGLVDVKGINTLTAKELAQLTAHLVLTRSTYSEVSKRYGSKHPKFIAALGEYRAAKAQLKLGEQKIQKIGQKGVKLRELKRQVKSNRQLYDTFLGSLKETGQSFGLQSANARIAEPAVASRTPIKPKKNLIIGLAFFASLMFGVLLAFLFEALDRTLKSAEDVEDKLGEALLGILPLLKVEKGNRKSIAQMTLEGGKDGGYAEAMRTIRTGLILSSLDNPHKIILLTSSVPGEGKTTVSSNLAVAMAKMEKVLLIGADLRRPTLSKVFDVDSELGLTNLVAGTAELSQCIHHVKKGHFDFLPCGRLPPNPLELLSSDRFVELMKELEADYDRIVIDSPPVQAVSDALVLSQFAKAVIYVVEADQTSDKLIKNGLKRLAQVGAPISGVVLNKFNIEKAGDYGGNDSGYYDAYGYGNYS